MNKKKKKKKESRSVCYVYKNWHVPYLMGRHGQVCDLCEARVRDLCVRDLCVCEDLPRRMRLVRAPCTVRNADATAGWQRAHVERDLIEPTLDPPPPPPHPDDATEGATVGG